MVVWRGRLIGDVAELVLALGFAIGLSPILDDRAASTLASSPTSRVRRVSARLAIIVPLGVASWVATRGLAITASMDRSVDRSVWSVWVPGREAWLVIAALSVLVVAIEARGSASAGSAGIAGSVCVLVFAGVVMMLPTRWSLLPLASRQVAWLALLGMSTLTVVLAMHDPGRSRVRLGRAPNGQGSPARPSVGTS